MGYNPSAMPRKIDPASEFGKRLYELRKLRGLTQIDLAQAINSTQRAISYYETVADFPPAGVIIDLAKALNVSADDLLGIKKPKFKKEPPEIQRLWRKFQKILKLPEKDRRAIIRMINSLVTAKQR